ncbi:hypothetical protein [Hoylesella oralis]|nr:hypothetical protein [Hoylesella oralis]
MKWQITDNSSLGFAYGLYSRMEKLDVYFVKNATTGQTAVNKGLDFTRSQSVLYLIIIGFPTISP